MSKFIGILSSSVVGVGLLAGMAQAEEINVATVNNGDMIIMQKLASERPAPFRGNAIAGRRGVFLLPEGQKVTQRVG